GGGVGVGGGAVARRRAGGGWGVGAGCCRRCATSGGVMPRLVARTTHSACVVNTESRASTCRGNLTRCEGASRPPHPVPYGSLCSSTRRFCARPAIVVFGAIGVREPYPRASMRVGLTPLRARYARTAAARACD